MVMNGSLSKRHLARARQVGAFNAENSMDARNRLGFEVSFMEDPLLAGILAARSAKGISHRMRAIALQEAKAEAKRIKNSGRQREAVQELVGPPGGLPTLRQDLLKLAAILHIDIAKKDTRAMLKEKCRPAIDLLMEGFPNQPKESQRPRTEPSLRRKHLWQRLQLRWQTAHRRSFRFSKNRRPAVSGDVPLQQVQQLMAEQEARCQTMLSQVFQHVMNLQGSQMLPQPLMLLGALWSDFGFITYGFSCNMVLKQSVKHQTNDMSCVTLQLPHSHDQLGWCTLAGQLEVV